jgi:hypothetical protein
MHWTELDLKTDNQDSRGWKMALSAVRNSAECRFIGLAQTGRRCDGSDYLVISAFEFLGGRLE